jgi:hypothetical protein
LRATNALTAADPGWTGSGGAAVATGASINSLCVLIGINGNSVDRRIVHDDLRASLGHTSHQERNDGATPKHRLHDDLHSHCNFPKDTVNYAVTML